MGANDHKPQVNRNAATGKQGKYGKLRTTKAQGDISWTNVDGPTIKRCIVAVTSTGDAITFGRTSDGGALAVTVLSGQERHKLYAAEVDEAEDMLRSIEEAAGL
jgi:hypothetical protein